LPRELCETCAAREQNEISAGFIPPPDEDFLKLCHIAFRVRQSRVPRQAIAR
jgi:hypothetical protein